MPLNKTLTELFRQVIIKEDLIDTGALLKGVRVFTDLKRDKIVVNITSKFYLKYLYYPYNLVQQFYSTPAFKKEVERILKPVIEHEIEAAIQGRPLIGFNPGLIIKVLGK